VDNLIFAARQRCWLRGTGRPLKRVGSVECVVQGEARAKVMEVTRTRQLPSQPSRHHRDTANQPSRELGPERSVRSARSEAFEAKRSKASSCGMQGKVMAGSSEANGPGELKGTLKRSKTKRLALYVSPKVINHPGAHRI
jgi:hypothetical protein